ncbi:Ribulosamine/erythrulosamine 3-kinase potentially involved in protein deglycation [hydrothermal vent metagenome]|uniref:Ribulosamine/erythrulosamine 3-kinase potentially involved in protein deglycation n=1 Tax=hydrothermal vent metagenome TaxID=652676 RepID=A0A3B0WUC3_9ZZZZ
MNWLELSESLNTQLAEQDLPPIHILSTHAISGGDSHSAYQLHTPNQNYFLKLAPLHQRPILEAEQHNLNALLQSNTLNCPTPYATGTYQEHAWLLMEFILLTTSGNEAQRGKDLALMHHQINRKPQPFGWFEDNFIGLTAQQNAWSNDWVHFYGQHRLLPQLELSQLKGAPSTLYQSGIKLIKVLPFWFQDYQLEASLLHGDLWAGNSAFTSEGEPIFFDPACYYGDRETDLAMTELFHGFNPDFYQGYHEIFPIDSGYQQRKPLYQLYHLLNHFNLFGGAYLQQAEQSIQQLLQQTEHSFF